MQVLARWGPAGQAQVLGVGPAGQVQVLGVGPAGQVQVLARWGPTGCETLVGTEYGAPVSGSEPNTPAFCPYGWAHASGPPSSSEPDVALAWRSATRTNTGTKYPLMSGGTNRPLMRRLLLRHPNWASKPD